MQDNDAAAVAQVPAGDRHAFGVLVERHGRAVFSLAFRMGTRETLRGASSGFTSSMNALAPSATVPSTKPAPFG